jgi:hypothetical protein
MCAQVSPTKGNVGFASAQCGWSFTLQSFARLYADVHGARMDAGEFARRLWGDVYYHAQTRTFRKAPPAGGGGGERSFVQFVLEPLYKIYSQVGWAGPSQIWLVSSSDVLLTCHAAVFFCLCHALEGRLSSLAPDLSVYVPSSCSTWGHALVRPM